MDLQVTGSRKVLLLRSGELVQRFYYEFGSLRDGVVDTRELATGNGLDVVELLVLGFAIVKDVVRSEFGDKLSTSARLRTLKVALHTARLFAEQDASTLYPQALANYVLSQS
jgi:hypothetical protein